MEIERRLLEMKRMAEVGIRFVEEEKGYSK